MTADIKECANPGHGDKPHHHYSTEGIVSFRQHHLGINGCGPCGYGAPLYQRTPDAVELVREVVETAKAAYHEGFDEDTQRLNAAIAALPADWAEHVAIVRKLTRDKVWATKVPDGYELVVVHAGGGSNSIDVLRDYHLDKFGFGAAYLLPNGAQA